MMLTFAHSLYASTVSKYRTGADSDVPLFKVRDSLMVIGIVAGCSQRYYDRTILKTKAACTSPPDMEQRTEQQRIR